MELTDIEYKNIMNIARNVKFSKKAFVDAIHYAIQSPYEYSIYKKLINNKDELYLESKELLYFTPLIWSVLCEYEDYFSKSSQFDENKKNKVIKYIKHCRKQVLDIYNHSIHSDTKKLKTFSNSDKINKKLNDVLLDLKNNIKNIGGIINKKNNAFMLYNGSISSRGFLNIFSPNYTFDYKKPSIRLYLDIKKEMLLNFSHKFYELMNMQGVRTYFKFSQDNRDDRFVCYTNYEDVDKIINIINKIKVTNSEYFSKDNKNENLTGRYNDVISVGEEPYESGTSFNDIRSDMILELVEDLFTEKQSSGELIISQRYKDILQKSIMDNILSNNELDNRVIEWLSSEEQKERRFNIANKILNIEKPCGEFFQINVREWNLRVKVKINEFKDSIYDKLILDPKVNEIMSDFHIANDLWLNTDSVDAIKRYETEHKYEKIFDLADNLFIEQQDTEKENINPRYKNILQEITMCNILRNNDLESRVIEGLSSEKYEVKRFNIAHKLLNKIKPSNNIVIINMKEWNVAIKINMDELKQDAYNYLIKEPEIKEAIDNNNLTNDSDLIADTTDEINIY